MPASTQFNIIKGSFRDPSGQVGEFEGRLLRTINASYQEHWEEAEKSGLFAELCKAEKLSPFRDVSNEFATSLKVWKVIEPERVPFVSYPYEWSFSQFKDAALLTLDVQRAAMKRGMTLKDASAYNVLFQGARPVFIDSLSFEKRKIDAPWQGYRQFCRHFLAPLLLARQDLRLFDLMRLWVDGVPLDLASSLLPLATRLSPAIQIHLHLHARAESKHADGRLAAEKVKKVRVSDAALKEIVSSLRGLVKKLALPANLTTEWGDYYNDTNYTEAGHNHKKSFVGKIAAAIAANSPQPGLALDLGANTGRYSEILGRHFQQVLAADIDPLAVERHYLKLKSENNKTILPLVLDLANPSPSLGWNLEERDSFPVRCRQQCSLVLELALVHHLTLTYGIPFSRQAGFFSGVLRKGGTLLAEFVPKNDSQVQRMLAARDDIFTDYTEEAFIEAMSAYFKLEERCQVADSGRVLLVFTNVRPACN